MDQASRNLLPIKDGIDDLDKLTERLRKNKNSLTEDKFNVWLVKNKSKIYRSIEKLRSRAKKLY